MTIKQLDPVVLEEDIPSHGLKRGDMGAVVMIYEEGVVEVEFVTASGRTQALLTLTSRQVRPLSAMDIPAVRKLDAA